MSQSSVASDRLLGKTLKGMYQLEAKVGQGGFGAVYRARHVKLGSAVAVKYLLPHADAGARERFDREAKISASIVHPNVARVMDIDHDEEGSPFIVMEWVAGTSLRHMLRERGALSFAETVELFHQFGSAMDAAHAKGVVHRDLKPENLMLTDEGGVVLLKVLDFGIARLANSQGTLTQGLVIGTPAYIAPELTLSGSKVADHRADIYAMGLILFECLAGRPAYQGDPMEIVSGHILGSLSVPTLSSVRPEATPELDGVIARACARNVAERFATAGDLANALSSVPPLEVRVAPTVQVGMAISRNPATGPRRALTPESLGSPSGLRNAVKKSTAEMPTLVTPGAANLSSSLSVAAGEVQGKSGGGGKAVFAVLAMLVLGGGGFAAWKLTSGSSTKVEPAPPPPVVIEKKDEPPPVVRLTVTGLPPDARIVDTRQPEVELSLVGGALVLARGMTPVDLEFSADHFEPRRERVVPELDGTLNVTLKPKPDAVAQNHHHHGPGPVGNGGKKDDGKKDDGTKPEHTGGEASVPID